jgi:hypothetical protein
MAGVDPRAVVLVEGPSDQAALGALARRQGRDLALEGIAIVDMGGITNLGGHLARLAAADAGTRVAGLYDDGEASYVQRILATAGADPADFHACVADLEDELIRALGVDAVIGVIEAADELRAFRSMQRQPAQVGRPVEAQLRRFMGTKGGRKVRYGRLLVEALDLDRVPRPLAAVLAPGD